MRAIDAVVLVSASALVAYALVGCGRRSARAVLASPARTPGVLNAEVTQAMIDATICTQGWTATVRPPTSYTSALKVRQMAEYGEAGSPTAYQEDHLISLELGGNPTDPGNSGPSPARVPPRSTRSRTSSTRTSAPARSRWPRRSAVSRR